MTNQLQGETLFQGWAGGTTDTNWAYTPWMPVRGNFATFGVEVLVSAGATLDWGVQTRTLGSPTAVDILTGTSVAPPVASSSPVVVLGMNTTAAQELVRYKFSTGSGFSTANFVTFRALAPSWQTDR